MPDKFFVILRIKHAAGAGARIAAPGRLAWGGPAASSHVQLRSGP